MDAHNIEARETEVRRVCSVPGIVTFVGASALERGASWAVSPVDIIELGPAWSSLKREDCQ